ncbi:diaminopimelate decarboxylase family protein [Candidatus Carsonella ruddii]|uniref:Diaminopimelate decarboxylase n=1 Tax=Candidatus Carsonella ruddii PC isolate NHV TaxID=1202540 RepID=J3Z2J9_CARRU|nr:diaminopimelate decarboxylase [Candidatus Carsonella ruddii]AFP84404.1 diaminopimelate decarboxylase [Candidatus Carsonella ruddii PC isolate NHV]
MIETNKNIYINNISIKSIFSKFSLPIYIYDYKKILKNLYLIKKTKIFCFYSIKSNNNKFLLKLVSKIIKNFDVVSIEEINNIIYINKKKKYIIFSGSGKTISEILISINLNIFSINVESVQELFKIFFFCNKYKKNINLMIRLNPNIDSLSHDKITTGKINNKFGINISNIKHFLLLINIMNFNFIGYDFHIGSQISKLSPIKKLFKIIKIINKYKKVNFVDIGGGKSINYYENKICINFNNYYLSIIKMIKKYNFNFKLIIELGRFFFGNTCIILSKVNYLKFNKILKIAILNVGMNDIIRPSLYNSYHKIESNNIGYKIKNIFGPICESSDKYNNINSFKINNNNLVIIYSCGSYCKVMSSNYNSKKKIFDIIIYKNKIKIIFKKEKFNNLINNYV